MSVNVKYAENASHVLLQKKVSWQYRVVNNELKFQFRIIWINQIKRLAASRVLCTGLLQAFSAEQYCSDCSAMN